MPVFKRGKIRMFFLNNILKFKVTQLLLIFIKKGGSQNNYLKSWISQSKMIVCPSPINGYEKCR